MTLIIDGGHLLLQVDRDVFHLQLGLITVVLVVVAVLLLLIVVIELVFVCKLFLTSSALRVVCLAVILLIIHQLASWWIGCPLLLIVLVVVVHEHVIEHLLALIVVALGCALVRLHHQRDFFSKLKQVYAVLRVATDDLCALDVREVVLEDLLTQQID